MEMEGESLPISEDLAGRILVDAVDQVHDYAIFLMDQHGVIVRWNRAAQMMKGYSAQDVLGSFFGMLYTEEDRKIGQPYKNLEIAAEHGTYQEEGWRRRKDGSLFWALIEIIALRNEDGTLLGFCKITRDLTSAKELQDQLAAERERAQVTLAAIGEAVISVDRDGTVEYLNSKAEQLTGWRNAEARGQSLALVFNVSDESSMHPRADQLVELLRKGQLPQPSSTTRLTHRDGTRFSIDDTVSPIRLKDGGIVGAVIVFRDVTKSRQLLNAATHQASHDALTGLVNRAEFDRKLRRSLERANRSGTPGAVLFMDLDQFKIVNDSCGHDAGDRLLCQIATLYASEVRERDILARIGGDEFALIADHCSLDEAIAIAEKILHSTRSYQYTSCDRVFSVGVSIGLATFDGSSRDLSEVVKRADQACYAAKRKGRNQIVCAGSDVLALENRRTDIDWVRRVAEGMQFHMLELYYQPIASAKRDEGQRRLEILLRLDDPEQGVILPGVFIPAAERYNLMLAVDRWVVAQLLEWLGQHHEHALQLDLCAVNLSSTTIFDDAFLGDLHQLLIRSPTAPDKLCFEIAGAAAVIDVQKSLALMKGLKTLGCKVSLGGVEVGTPSFSYLKQFPADFLKINASPAASFMKSVAEERMLISTNEIAHLMGQETIGEGVEDQQTEDALVRFGVDYLQGNWIGPPRKMDTLLPYIG